MRLQNRATIEDFKNAQDHGIYFGQKGGNYRSPLTLTNRERFVTPPVLFYKLN
jgi:hypothetical protein